MADTMLTWCNSAFTEIFGLYYVCNYLVCNLTGGNLKSKLQWVRLCTGGNDVISLAFLFLAHMPSSRSLKVASS